MATSGLMTARRFSHSTRLRLQVLFARAWEALAETHRTQAADFVHRLRPRLPVDEALDRYFREVGVPAPMADTVRARALIALAHLVDEVPEAETRASGWSALRPDLVIGTLRRRVQYVEDTNLECRLAASLSDEAVAATHVAMAIETARLLVGECSPDEAIMHYVRTFSLPSIEVQIIFRRALAQWAEREGDTVERPAASTALTVCTRPPQLEFGGRFRLGLRATG